MNCINCTKPLNTDQIIARLANERNGASTHGPYCGHTCHQVDRRRRIEARAAA